MVYKEFQPGKYLRPYVECYWYAYSDKPPFREKESLIPDGTIELMFNFGDPYAQFVNNEAHAVKGAHIIGIRRQSLLISQTSRQHFFCIRFRLGGTYPFFRLPAHLFANHIWQLQELFGNEFRELEHRLAEAGSHQARIALVEGYLLGRLHTGINEYDQVMACSRYLLQPGGNKVAALASRFNTNYKTLERRFRNVLGITPAELMKISRFNTAVHEMYSCRHETLTHIALACGYYDQSHFIREFRQLTGFSPREFLRQQFTIVQVIQPALAERLSKSYNL